MKKLKSTFTKFEKLLHFIILGSITVNALIFGIIYLFHGDVPQWITLVVMLLLAYYFIIFFVYLVRIFLYYTRDHEKDIKIWKSILGLLLSVFGLLLAVLNVILLAIASI